MHDKKEKINPEGKQDRQGNYDIDGVSYSENEIHVGSEPEKQSKKNSDKKEKKTSKKS